MAEKNILVQSDSKLNQPLFVFLTKRAKSCRLDTPTLYGLNLIIFNWTSVRASADGGFNVLGRWIADEINVGSG